MDLLRAPSRVPRVTRIGGQKVLFEKFRTIVRETMDARLLRMEEDRGATPEDFLTLLLDQAKSGGLTNAEIEDNIPTSPSAPAMKPRPARSPDALLRRQHAAYPRCDGRGDRPRACRRRRTGEVARSHALYPRRLRGSPAPLSAGALDQPRRDIDDRWTNEKGETAEIEAGVTVLIMPWTPHRHELYWDKPRAYMPERFCSRTAPRSAISSFFQVRRRPARLHRRHLRAAGGGHRARCHDASLPLRHDG